MTPRRILTLAPATQLARVAVAAYRAARCPTCREEPPWTTD